MPRVGKVVFKRDDKKDLSKWDWVEMYKYIVDTVTDDESDPDSGQVLTKAAYDIWK
jgi:hypothetical protein